MIKLVYCIHRKPGLSVEEFRKYWLETHAAFGKNITGVKRYVQVHALGGELQDMLAAMQDEANFIDFDRSIMFLAREHVIVDG